MVATPPALVPNAIAFRDPNHGLLGARGTISASADGGRTWRVVLRTPRAVVRVGFRGRSEWAELADGRTLASDDGRTWRRGAARRPLPLPCRSPLPGGVPSVRAGRSLWAVCLGGAGAGAMAKAV